MEEKTNEPKATAYRIYHRVNYADTSRDPDNIHIRELGYRKDLEDAKAVAYEYIKESFFQKDTKLHENDDGSWRAIDFRSYGPSVIIEPINIL